MRLEPLGDQAVMAYCPGEEAAFALASRCRSAHWPWLVDVVQAYTSVAVFYDLNRIAFDGAAEAISALEPGPSGAVPPGLLHPVPCCYELGPDLQRVADYVGRTAAEVVALHSQAVYTVYAIGFCPGFPYLGYLPDALAGVPRLATPRLRVDEGSVGMTGRQTGIYTQERPGGWNIIGRTPLELVDVTDGYFPMQTGDRVQFVSIDVAEFQRQKGRRLPG